MTAPLLTTPAGATTAAVVPAPAAAPPVRRAWGEDFAKKLLGDGSAESKPVVSTAMTYAKATGLAALDGVEIGVLGLLAGAAHRRGLLNPGVSGVLGLLALAASAPASVHSPSPVARSVTSDSQASSPRRSLRVPGTATRSNHHLQPSRPRARVAKIRLPLRGERQTCCEPASHHFARGGIRLGGRCRIRAAHGRPVECGHRCPRRPCVRGGIAQAGREGEEVGRAPSADRGGRAGLAPLVRARLSCLRRRSIRSRRWRAASAAVEH